MNEAKPLTPEEQAYLDALEPSIEVLCSVGRGEDEVPHAAEVALRCRSCGVTLDIVCKHHARGFAARCAADAITGAFIGKTWVIECKKCHKVETSVDDLIEVVHL